jgi:acyl carrier protein
MHDIKAEVRAFIASNFFIADDAGRLKDSDSFLDNHIVDSTGFLELISHLEHCYHIRIEDREMVPENLDSLDNIEAFVRRKCARA